MRLDLLLSIPQSGLLRQSCLIKVSPLGGVWMANQWLTPRGRWRILLEFCENREFRSLILMASDYLR
ncbi:unnamed protein product [Ascophyllum nodosum]